MEFRQLQYFLTLAEELHFSKAAKRLCIEQPSLSRQIKQLEEELGLPLFTRTKRLVRLTPAGQYLLAESGRLLAHRDLVRNRLAEMQTDAAGCIKIGYVGAAMHSLLPGLLRALKAGCPELRPVLRELDHESQLQCLRKGEIDLGFMRMPDPVEDLRYERICAEDFVLILARTKAAAMQRQIALSDLAGDPCIAFCRSCSPGMYDAMLKICRREGFAPRIVHESSQLNTVLRLVESDLGYAIVPAGVLKGYDLALEVFPLGDIPEKAELSAAFNAKNTNPALAKIMHFVAKLGAELALGS